jgi:hypothetical protein
MKQVKCEVCTEFAPCHDMVSYGIHGARIQTDLHAMLQRDPVTNMYWS